MAPVFVQKTSNSSVASATTIVATPISAFTNGNTVRGVVSCNDGVTTCTLKDNNNVTYTVVDTVDDAANGTILFSFRSPTGGVTGSPTSLTATFGGTITFRSILVQEWSGIDVSASPIDAHNMVAVASGSTPTTANVATVADGDLLVASVVPDSASVTTITAGTDGHGNSYLIRNTESAVTSADESQIQTTHNATTSASFSFGIDASAAIISITVFKAAAAAAAAPGKARILATLFGPRRGPTRGLRRLNAYPAASLATTVSATWSSVGAANDAIWTGAAIDAATWSSAGVGAATWTGAAIFAGTWSSVGSGAAPWTGAAIGAATWSSVGSGAATWTGAAIGVATWSSTGLGAAQWIGAATAASTWSSVGSGIATWVGTGILGGVWSSAGAGSATWVGLGISIQSGVWSSAGAANDAIWSGASVFAGTWSASGIGSASWTGAATAASTWTSTGNGGASWTGSAILAGTWGAAGLGSASWVGTTPSAQGALAANGIGAAFWIGANASAGGGGPVTVWEKPFLAVVGSLMGMQGIPPT